MVTKTLIIGYGEIGKAIAGLETTTGHDLDLIDLKIPAYTLQKKYEVIHICIPHSKDFIKSINKYLRTHKSDLVIIHSTVPVGTCRKLKPYKYLVHSPVRGLHPYLITSIKTFIKYVGGSKEATTEAIKYLNDLGLNAQELGTFETTELAKLLSTSYYGWNIAFATHSKRLCDAHKIDYNKIYSEWNKTYNSGYKQLNMPQFIRPILRPSKNGLGGHCVFENAQLLNFNPISKEITNLKKKKK